LGEQILITCTPRSKGFTRSFTTVQTGGTINVDLDPVVPGIFNGMVFRHLWCSCDSYTPNTPVIAYGNDVIEFQTDNQGRFTAELAPGFYFFEVWWLSCPQLVEIQGEYQDIVLDDSEYCEDVDKPNIYLYPEEAIELDVEIVFPNGGMVVDSVPDYGDGWHVTVEPSGLIDGQYEYLFYEGSLGDYSQYDAGWVVPVEELEGFFRDNMALTGFTEKEIDDFVEYWIPRLTDYPYYAMYPQYNDQLEDMLRLEFSIQPDSLIRLIYCIRGLADGNLSLAEPTVPVFEREGFTVAEWGVILK